MFRRPFPFLLLLALLLLPTKGRAEPVDLSQALREAVEARPAAQAARMKAAAAEAAVGEARSRFLPRVLLEENFLWTDEPAASLFIDLNQESLVVSQDADIYNFPPDRRDFETRLTLRQPLYEPGIGLDLARSRTLAEAARADSRQALENAAFAAFRAYLGVQDARAALDWAESSRQEAAELVRLAAEREEAGTGLKADRLRARVALAEAEQRLLTLGNDLVLARRTLALALGRPGGEVDIAAPLEAESLAPPDPKPLQRHDLKALDLQAEAARLAWRHSHSAYRPRLALEAGYVLHDPETPFGTDAGSWRIGAGLEWELFDGFRRRHAVDRTAAEHRAAEHRFHEAYRQADFARDEARLRAEEAEGHLGQARQARQEAEESYRLLQERYRAGLADLADLLAARAALDRARYAVVAAGSRRLLALGNIRFQRGDFLEEFLPAAKETSP